MNICGHLSKLNKQELLQRVRDKHTSVCAHAVLPRTAVSLCAPLTAALCRSTCEPIIRHTMACCNTTQTCYTMLPPQAFKQLGKDASGTITTTALLLWLDLNRYFNYLCCLHLLLQAFKQLDKDVIGCCKSAAAKHLLLPNICCCLHLPPQAFKQLDKDASGTITIEELSEALRVFGIYDDAKELLASADTNGDGLIDYAEFSWLLRNHNEALRVSGRAEAKGHLARFF